MDDRQLGRLLAGRDEPSILEKEEVLRTVLARSRRRKRTRWSFGVLGAIGAAAAWALVVPTDEFTPRGDATRSVDFSVRCGSSPPGRCKLGEVLQFEVGSGAGHRFFAAFARDGRGRVVWYYPAPGDRSLSLGENTGTDAPELLQYAVELGDPHGEGTYTVVGLFSGHPLTRDQLKAALERDPKSPKGMIVVRRMLVIGAATAREESQ